MKRLALMGSLILMLGTAIHAQLNQAELQSMPMWPAGSPTWLGTTWFQKAGDYGYYYDNTRNTIYAGGLGDNDKWRYAYYVGLAGKRVIAYGDWYQPTVGPPVRNPDGRIGDNCLHTHITYGVWFQYGYYSGGVYYTGFIPVQGGSKSGVRVNDNYCYHSVKNTLTSIDARYGWGVDYVDIRFGATTPFIGMVVGASAVSHGSFGCGAFACVNNPMLIAYTLQ